MYKIRIKMSHFNMNYFKVMVIRGLITFKIGKVSSVESDHGLIRR